MDNYPLLTTGLNLSFRTRCDTQGVVKLHLVSCGGVEFGMSFPARILAGLIGVLVSVSAYQGALAGNTGSDAKPGDKKSSAPAYHDMSLFSFMQLYGPRGRHDSPVLVTVRVEGEEGAQNFCTGRPLVRDAVLGVLSFGRTARDAGGDLEKVRPRLVRAVAGALPPGTVKTISLKQGRTPAEFSGDMTRTNDTCNSFKE